VRLTGGVEQRQVEALRTREACLIYNRAFEGKENLKIETLGLIQELSVENQKLDLGGQGLMRSN
jgi:hypothetical protein